MRKQTNQLENGPKHFTDISPKKQIQKTWKDLPHHKSSWKCKLKQQWISLVDLLEWQKSRMLLIPNAGKENETA